MRHVVKRHRLLTGLFTGLTCVAMLFNTTAVSAITANDLKSVQDNTAFYDPLATMCGSAGTTTTTVAPGTLPSIIPEPYNGAFTQGGNNHKVAPALVAAIFTEENFTHTDPSQLAARWKSFVQSRPDPNSNWPYSNVPPTEVWPDGEVGAGGPFQFEPNTWKQLGAYPYTAAARDNLVTAADAAADYLASNGATIDKPPASWNAAILQYNDAQWYADAVMEYYNFYTGGKVSTTPPPATATLLSSTTCANTTALVSVSCANGSTSQGLSAARQNAVCLAQNELALWKSGKMHPGFRACSDQTVHSTCDSFAKYTQNNDELWCADFVSWLYNNSGYPIGSGANWRIPGVIVIAQIGEQDGKWHYHTPDPNLKDAGRYAPKVGDLVIHDTSAHVNIIVPNPDGSPPSPSELTMIGGDQAGTSFPDGSSVSEYTTNSWSSDGISGFVSPD